MGICRERAGWDWTRSPHRDQAPLRACFSPRDRARPGAKARLSPPTLSRIRCIPAHPSRSPRWPPRSAARSWCRVHRYRQILPPLPPNPPAATAFFRRRLTSHRASPTSTALLLAVQRRTAEVFPCSSQGCRWAPPWRWWRCRRRGGDDGAAGGGVAGPHRPALGRAGAGAAGAAGGGFASRRGAVGLRPAPVRRERSGSGAGQ